MAEEETGGFWHGLGGVLAGTGDTEEEKTRNQQLHGGLQGMFNALLVSSQGGYGQQMGPGPSALLGFQGGVAQAQAYQSEQAKLSFEKMKAMATAGKEASESEARDYETYQKILNNNELRKQIGAPELPIPDRYRKYALSAAGAGGQAVQGSPASMSGQATGAGRMNISIERGKELYNGETPQTPQEARFIANMYRLRGDEKGAQDWDNWAHTLDTGATYRTKSAEQQASREQGMPQFQDFDSGDYTYKVQVDPATRQMKVVGVQPKRGEYSPVGGTPQYGIGDTISGTPGARPSAPPTGGSQPTGAAGGTAGFGAVQPAIDQQESGGNYGAFHPNDGGPGMHSYGRYQINQSTLNSWGISNEQRDRIFGRPDANGNLVGGNPQAQDQLAQRYYNESVATAKQNGIDVNSLSPDQQKEYFKLAWTHGQQGAADIFNKRGVTTQAPGAPQTQGELSQQRKQEVEAGIDIGKNTYKKITESLPTLDQGINNLELVSGLLERGVPTGKVTNATLPVRQWAKQLHLLTDEAADQVGDQELLTSVQNRMAMILRNPESGGGLPGSASDRDVQFLKDAVPSLEKTPAGNRLITLTALAVMKRERQLASATGEYLTQGGSYQKLSSFTTKWRDENPLLARPKSPEDAQNLPAGSIFVTPKGELRVR